MIEDRAYDLVTVFGGAGFIGRYVCEELLAAGVRVRIASRNPRTAYFIQPLGQVGQLGMMRAEVRNPDSVRRAVEGASAVVNLCGSFGHMQSVHVTGARTIAEAARDAGAGALVHVSAIGADPESESVYGRTKGEGELAVGKAFPGATIIRPSIVFGPEDNFTNRFAALGKLPFVPVIAPKCRFQPVFVEDLASAIARSALDRETHGGRTYEIGGPEILTMRELMAGILHASGRTSQLIDVPDVFASVLSLFGFLPGAPLTRDQWLMLQRDNVAADGAPGLDAFGIQPTPFDAVADAWLGRYWRGGRFAMRTSGGHA